MMNSELNLADICRQAVKLLVEKVNRDDSYKDFSVSMILTPDELANSSLEGLSERFLEPLMSSLAKQIIAEYGTNPVLMEKLPLLSGDCSVATYDGVSVRLDRVNNQFTFAIRIRE